MRRSALSRRPGVAAAWLLLLVVSAPAHAAEEQAQESERLRLGGVEISPSAGELNVFLGAVKEDGTPAKVSDVRLLFDGNDAGPPAGQAHLAEYASENPKWTPPLAVGLVYLWAPGAPQGMIDGIEGLAKRLPARTAVYPTPYGQGYRPVVTKLTAARAASGDLADYPPIAGDRHKLIDAIRFNARKLAEDPADFKYLLIVTDGRGYESAREKGPFAALGQELVGLRVNVLLVSFSAPVDGAESAANVRELAQASRARHVVVDRAADLPALVESMAEIVTGLDLVRFKIPWSALSHTRKVAVTANVEGASLMAVAGTATLPGRGAWLVVLLLVSVVLGATLTALLLAGKISFGKPRAVVAPPGVFRDADELVRIGLSPERAVIELSRSRPDKLEELRAVEAAKISARYYPHLRSRAGLARLKEIQKLLARAETHQVIDDQEAQIIGAALREGASAAEAARRIRARIPGERWSMLARARGEDLQDAARAAGRKIPELDTQRGVEFIEGVQDALRSRDDNAVMVGWLVRAAGPGQRGETLPIEGKVCVIGRRNGDMLLPEATDDHAEIKQVGADFVIAPMDGAVEVEGEEIEQPHALVDGETIRIGRGAFVFRSVRWGISAATTTSVRESRAPGRPNDRSRRRTGRRH